MVNAYNTMKSIIIPKNKTRLLVFNTTTRIVSTAGIVIIGIVVLPMKLNYFGKEVFGVYQLAISVVQYLSRADFGIGATIKKFVPSHAVKKQYSSLGKLLGFSLFFNFFLGLAIAGIFITIGYLSNYLFSLSGENFIIFKTLSWILALRMFFDRTLAIFPAFMEGMQRHFVVNGFRLIQFIFDLILIIYIIHTKQTIVDYALILTIIIIILKVGIIIVSKWSFNFLQFNRFKFDKIKEYLSFSWHMAKSQIASLLQFESDRIILGIFTNPITVTYYHVGERIHYILRRMVSQVFSSLLPLLSERYAESDNKYIKKALFDGSRIMVLLWFPIILVLIFNTKEILRLWLGSEYTFLNTFAALFLAPYLITIPQGILTNSLIAKGSIKKYMNFRIIAAGTNVLLSIIFVQFYGIWGVLIGTLVQVVIFNLYLYKILFQKLEIIPVAFIQKVIQPCFASIIVVLISCFFLKKYLEINGYIELGIALTLPLILSY